MKERENESKKGHYRKKKEKTVFGVVFSGQAGFVTNDIRKGRNLFITQKSPNGSNRQNEPTL